MATNPFWGLANYQVVCQYTGHVDSTEMWIEQKCLLQQFCFTFPYRLVCAVSYATINGDKMYFRKFFKFQVINFELQKVLQLLNYK